MVVAVVVVVVVAVDERETDLVEDPTPTAPLDIGAATTVASTPVTTAVTAARRNHK